MDASKIESLTSGTVAGAGSFRCQRCGYVLNLVASDTLSDCPSCGSASFVRASLFSTAVARAKEERIFAGESELETAALLARAREQIERELDQKGEGFDSEHLAYEQDGELVVVPLTREWTRIGRSLTADVRFDDPTVSRRHALVVRHPDGVRVLDDRSLNGVFVNGERIEWRALQDGDEIVVGRYKLCFLRLDDAPASQAAEASGELLHDGLD